MFSNYFKTTFRNLLKNKFYSSLNIFGLTIGIACAGLIFLWVEDEINFDGFNTKKDRLYFARVNATLEAGVFTHWSSPGVLGPAMQAEVPGIANTCRTTEGSTKLLFTIGDKTLYASGKYAEASLFNMFTLPFLEGNAQTAFSQLYSLVITQKTAIKFFGDSKKAMGRQVRVDNKQDYVVTGILKDIPANSSLMFEWVAPFQIYYQQSPWAYKWENNCMSTYVELKPGVDVAGVNKVLFDFVQKRAPTSIGHIFLFPMNDWHLRGRIENGKPTGSGFIVYVRLFSLIAWIILFIACINFMNLATARSEKRAREVGVRKVLGAMKARLATQFIAEALFMAFMAAVGAILLMQLVLSSFNTLVQKNLSLELNNPLHLSAILVITLICGLVAGSYPSLYLSSFNPVFVLKGLKLKSGSAVLIRKSLVVIQFTVSIALIIATIIIYRQIRYVKSRDLGFDKTRLIELNLQGDMGKNWNVIKQDLLNTGMIENAALSDHSTIDGGNNTDGLTWDGKAPGKIIISSRSVTPEFFHTSGIKILDGRDFVPSDSVNFDNPSIRPNVIITQSLANLMGEASPLGKKIFAENDTSLSATVVGVVNDYVYGDMYGKPDPVVFICTSPRFETVMYVRTKPNVRSKDVLSKMKQVMKANNPAYPFEYQFVDDQFSYAFTGEMLISKLSTVFSTLAIIISCLGLFGLAAYTAERRKKEIGIRKVLGASVSGITGLLSINFLQLVILSCVVAFPLAWLVMNNWLHNYQFRITITWWTFLLAGIIAIMIALLTISIQTIRAALANPVKSLRSE